MYIGLDLGTSSLKGVLIDDTQRIVAEASAALNVDRPQAGFCEQTPADWIAAAERVLDELAAYGLSQLRGIGLSGQMHGAVVLDGADQVLRPCILWNDTRSADEAQRLDRDPQFRAVTGNIVFPGFTAPKLMWLAQHEPHVFAKIAKVLLPKDYLRLWLTGEYVSEMSDAAGTSWLDTKARDWSDALLTASGMRRDQMPRLVEGSAVSGHVRHSLAARWNMPRDVIVAGGAGDNAAAALGVGAVKRGQAFVSLGTSGVLFAADDRYNAAPESAVHSFCHALPNTWHQMGVILSCTDALNWWARICGSSAQALVAEVTDAPPAPLFLPYLGGERTPLNDAHIRGGFLRLDHGHERADMTRALLDGVCFALRDCRDALAAAGNEIGDVIAVGGGAQSDLWLSRLAQALDRPVLRPATSAAQGAAFGAARLALMAATGAGVQIATPPKIAAHFRPNAANKSAWDDAYARYRSASTLVGAMK